MTKTGRDQQATLHIPASRLGAAIVWLRDHGVSAERLAAVLNTTGLNIRQIDYRQRRRPPDEDEPRVSVRTLGLRLEEDASGASGRRAASIAAIRQKVETIRRSRVSDGRYLAAASELKLLHAFRGFPSSLDWLRVMGELHREQAWFLVHSGRTRDALNHAAVAIALGKRVLRLARRPSPADAKNVVDASLIQAHAHLMRREPGDALLSLELVEQASEAARLTLGSDYFRQRGIVLLQKGSDEAAIRYFRKSGDRMSELGEGSHPLSVSITNSRYVNLLNAQIDGALELASLASTAFGTVSMETSVSSNFAIASVLSTDTEKADSLLAALLDKIPGLPQFGHQATLKYLLSITPQLKLPLPIRRAWLRQALYMNAADR